MIYNRIQHAVHKTHKFLSRSYDRAVRMAGAFDHGMNFAAKVARTVAPLMDQYTGTATAKQARSFGDDYQLLRTKVLGLHHEGQTATSHIVGSLRKGVPELGL